MDWVTVSDERSEARAQEKRDAVTNLVIAHEAFEHQAKTTFEAGLVDLKDNRFLDAKRRFQHVLEISLAETPFRTRIRRSAYKNIARCYEELGDYARAVDAASHAATYLDRDDGDVALWFLLRRLSARASNLPLFQLASSVLQDLGEDVEPMEVMSQSISSLDESMIDRTFPKSVTVDISESMPFQWMDLIGILENVSNEELITIRLRKKIPEIYDAKPSVAEPPIEQQPVVMQSAPTVTTTEAPDQANVSQITPPRSKKRTRAETAQAGRETKRQQGANAAAEQENEEDDEIDPTELLPPRDDLRITELHMWFESRVAQGDDVDDENEDSKQSRSPVREGFGQLSPTKEAATLDYIKNQLLSMAFPVKGDELLVECFRVMYNRLDSVPANPCYALFTLCESRGIKLRPEYTWLGRLARAETKNALTEKSVREIVQAEVDMVDEVDLLGFALECEKDSEEAHLAAKILRRATERARMMKRPLLADIALSRLEQLERSEDQTFIRIEREKLVKSTNNEKIDTVLDECAMDSAQFAKDPQTCLVTVYQACMEVNRGDVFERYRFDMLQRGLERHSQEMLRIAFEFVGTSSHGSSFTSQDQDEEEERVWPLMDDVERFACRLLKIFPVFFCKGIIELLDYSGSNLWERMIAAAWAWVGRTLGGDGAPDENETLVRATEVQLHTLSSIASVLSFESIPSKDKLCILHSMTDVDARRPALLCFQTFNQPATLTVQEKIENAFGMCEYAMEEGDLACEDVFEFLLHDKRLSLLFREMRSAGVFDDDANLELEEEREFLLGESACRFFFPQANDDAGGNEERPAKKYDLRMDDTNWLEANAPRIWEFLVPHLWSTNKSGKLPLTLQEKRNFLEQRLLRVVSEAPVTASIYEIHAGGIWYHMTRLDISKDAEDAGEDTKDTDKTETSKDKLEAASSARAWLERDLQVEPRRLRSLLGLTKIMFRDEFNKQLEESRQSREAARKQEQRQEEQEDHPPASITPVVPLTPKSSTPTSQHRETPKTARTYKESLDCLGEIDRVLVRDLPKGVRPCALVKWRGRWAICTRVYPFDAVTSTSTDANGEVDLLTLDEEQAKFNDLKERQARLSQGDEESSSQGLSPRVPNPKRARVKESASKKQCILRCVPLSEVECLTVDDFRIAETKDETMRYFLADVFPSELIKMKLDVAEYMNLKMQWAKKGMDQWVGDRRAQVLQCIDMCELTSDDRLWSFFWFLAAHESEDAEQAMEAYFKAASMASRNVTSRKTTKKQKSEAFCFKVGATECACRGWEISLDLHQDKKEQCLKELQRMWKSEDKQNLLLGRLLQTLQGPEDDSLKDTLTNTKRWDAGSIMFDHIRELVWEDELAETFQCRLEALKAREKPFEGAKSLLEIYNRKKLNTVVSKAQFSELIALIVTKGIPQVDLKETFKMVSLYSKYSQIKRACDARMTELGETQLGLKSLSEVVDYCKTRFKDASDMRGSKLFSSGKVPPSTQVIDTSQQGNEVVNEESSPNN